MIFCFACLSLNCLAQDIHEVSLGNCGFAGPDYLTNDLSCDHFRGSSDTALKKEAALQLLTTAWKWITGQQADQGNPQSAYGYDQKNQLNKGQKFEPQFRLKAHSEDLYLVVAYEF